MNVPSDLASDNLEDEARAILDVLAESEEGIDQAVLTDSEIVDLANRFASTPDFTLPSISDLIATFSAAIPDFSGWLLRAQAHEIGDGGEFVLKTEEVMGRCMEAARSEGLEIVGVVRPNNSPSAVAHLYGYWPPSHKGEQVLYAPNYTMAMFAAKNFDGTTNQQFATDAIVVKCLSSQHTHLPVTKSERSVFADQFRFFTGEGVSEKRATRQIVNHSLDFYERTIRTAALSTGFRIPMGGPVKDIIWGVLDRIQEWAPGHSVSDITIQIPCPAVPSQKFSAGKMSDVHARCVYDSDGALVSIWAPMIHLSAMAYGKKGNPVYYLPKAIAADCIINFAVFLSGKITPAEEYARVTKTFTPKSGQADPRFLTKQLVQLRRMELDDTNGFQWTKETLPSDIGHLATVNCLFDDPEGVEGKHLDTLCAKLLSRQIKRGLSAMSKDKKEKHRQNLSKARLAYSPAKKAAIKLLMDEARSKFTPEMNAHIADGARKATKIRVARIAAMSAHDQTWIGFPAYLKPPSSDCFVEYKLSRHSEKPTYRIEQQDMIVHDHRPLLYNGRLVNTDEWLIIAKHLRYAYDAKGNSKPYSAPDTLDVEPFYCSSMDLLLLYSLVRTPGNDIKLSAAMLRCPGCKTGDMGGKKIGNTKDAVVKDRSHCGPVLAFRKILPQRAGYVVANRRGPYGRLVNSATRGMICDRTSTPPLANTLQSTPFAKILSTPTGIKLRQDIAAAEEADPQTIGELEKIIMASIIAVEGGVELDITERISNMTFKP